MIVKAPRKIAMMPKVMHDSYMTTSAGTGVSYLASTGTTSSIPYGTLIK
jgi:hypothetical protein